MPLLHQSYMELELQSLKDGDTYDHNDNEHDDECNRSLVIRHTANYSTRLGKLSSDTKLTARQKTETKSVDQAIACALKSRPKAFHYTQKKLQYLPPSIQHLAVYDTLIELDLHGNQLKSLPNEIEKLKLIEICNLGKIIFSLINTFTSDANPVHVFPSV